MPLADDAKFCDKCGKPVGAATRQTPIPPPVPPAQSQPDSVPAQPQYGNSQGPFYAAAPKKSGKKGGIFGLIGFILLGIVLLVMLLAAEATPVGWAVCLGLFAIAFIIQWKLRQRGCLIHLILWVITGFLLLITLTMFTEGDLSFTTAGLKNAHMTTAIDANGKPVDEVSSYLPNAPELVAVADLRNAPTHTQVKFVWKYVTQDVLITEYIMDSGENDANVYVFSNITNDKPWPEGEYKVEMYIEDRKTPDAVIVFKVGTAANKAATAAANPSNKKERTLTAIELEAPKPWYRTGDTNLKDHMVYEKELYNPSSVIYVAASFKIGKDAYQGMGEGFEKYFIDRDETHTIIGTPEKRKIGDWDAVRCLVKLMPNDPKYYLFYFIDVEGENDVVCYIFNTDQTVVYELAEEWEKYWPNLKLIY